ncbi:MAG: hypothetical protein EA405_13650 [Rhodospirillales bacterium]|nr:MAG: hypothetical protein EA405_13650 [Rhodospirillales bacterium]
MPNLGVYFDRPSIALPERALKDCRNVRVKNGKVVRDNMGWGHFPSEADQICLCGQAVMGIDNFFPTAGGQLLLFGTTRDLYRYRESEEDVVFINPRYEAGTIAVTNASATVTGTGTAWLANVEPGDFLHVGATGQTDPAAEWLEIATVVSDTELTLAAPYAGSTASGQSYTARNIFHGDLVSPWKFETFPMATNVVGSDGDRWYATNGRDRVVGWDGVATQVYRPDLGDMEKASFMVRHKNMMIYGDITRNGTRRPFSIRNSNIGEPENVVSGLSAEFVVHDGVDTLLTAATLGDNLVIYGERSVTLAQFVGPDLMFIFRSVISGLGPLSSRAVADFGDFHQFIGPDAQYRFDGISVQEIGFQVFREVTRKQSPQRREMIFGHFDEENGELLWVMPLTTDPDPDDGPPTTAYVEHYLEGVGNENPSPFTVRDLPATAMGFYDREATLTWDAIEETWQEMNFRWDDRFLQGAFPFNLMGTADGYIYVLGSVDSKVGEPIHSWARFGRRPLGTVRRKGMIQRVYPFAKQMQGAGYPLNVRLHMSNTTDGDTGVMGPYPFDLTMATSKHFVSTRAVGRYVELEFSTNGVGRGWEITGYDMDIAPAGER